MLWPGCSLVCTQDIPDQQTFRIQVDSPVTLPSGVVVPPGVVWACVLGHGARALEASRAKAVDETDGTEGAGDTGDADGPRPFVLRGMCLFFSRWDAEQRVLSDPSDDGHDDEPHKAVGNPADMVCSGCGKGGPVPTTTVLSTGLVSDDSSSTTAEKSTSGEQL